MVKIIGLSSFLCSSDMSGASSFSCINMSSIPGTGVFSRLVTVFIPTNQESMVLVKIISLKLTCQWVKSSLFSKGHGNNYWKFWNLNFHVWCLKCLTKVKFEQLSSHESDTGPTILCYENRSHQLINVSWCTYIFLLIHHTNYIQTLDYFSSLTDIESELGSSINLIYRIYMLLLLYLRRTRPSGLEPYRFHICGFVQQPAGQPILVFWFYVGLSPDWLRQKPAFWQSLQMTKKNNLIFNSVLVMKWGFNSLQLLLQMTFCSFKRNKVLHKFQRQFT